MKILILGKNGQVGSKLASSLHSLGELVPLGRDECDITETGQLRKVLMGHHPDILINASAYTAVDKAETERELAFRVNSQAVCEMAKITQEIGAWFIHYSTDYVFDGEKQSPYMESDPAKPTGVYGLSKLQGEKHIMDLHTKYMILRTSWVYGEHGHNFPKTILKLAGEREKLNVVHDQVGTPTHTSLIAGATSRIIDKLSQMPAPSKENETNSLSGIYHITSRGEGSWYEFAFFLLTSAREFSLPLKCSPESISPVPSTEYPTATKRPSYSVLSTKKLTATFDIQLSDWREDARGFVQSHQWEKSK